jgi:hypothetical protein
VSLTPEGAAAFALWASLPLSEAVVVVRNDTQEARAFTQGPPVVTGGVVTLTAVFRENEANFDWQERQVVLGEEILDSERGDFGRKSEGAIWTVEVPIELQAAPD